MTLLAKLDLIYHFADVPCIAIEALKECERLVDRQLLGELRVLQLDSEQLSQILLVRLPSSAQYFDIARIGAQKPLADFDRRRLSGAVRTEESKAFSSVDLEVQTVDGDDVAVRFAESPDAQRGSGQLCVCHHRGRRV